MDWVIPLQELRPPRRSSSAWPTRSSASPGRSPLLDVYIAPSSKKIALEDEYFVSRASCIPTSISTAVSSTARSASRWRCSPCSLRSGGPLDGSRSGRSRCSTQSRRSRDRGRSTPAVLGVPTGPWTGAAEPCRPTDTFARRGAPWFHAFRVECLHAAYGRFGPCRRNFREWDGD